MAIFLLAAGAPAAWAQEEPSFDCKKAHTQVEHVLCSGGNSGMGWIDQTMDRLYKAARAVAGPRAGALQASQRAWLGHRNQCHGDETKIMNCLLASYRQRYAEIAAPYDTAHVTGAYWDDRIGGSLQAVLFPDRSVAVTADSSTGPPAYNSCTLTLQAPLAGNIVTYTPSAEETGGGQCSFILTVSGNEVIVKRNGCEGFCGHNAEIAGTYKRQP